MKTNSPSPAARCRLQSTLSSCAVIALLLSGCVVMSIYPYYATKDLTFDPVLLGTWSDPADTNATKETWTFAKQDDQSYQLEIRDNQKTNAFDTHLFTLGGTKFLDVLPCERHEYHPPAHLLLRVIRLQPQLEMHVLKYDWLAKQLDKNPKALRHIVVPKSSSSEAGETLTLTADTAELQRFIRKHLNNTNAWGEITTLKKH